MLKVNVYVAALYVPKTSSDPNVMLSSPGPNELILQFVRNVGADDIRKGWTEGIREEFKDQMPALKDRIAMLNGWMADVKTGDNGDVRPQAGHRRRGEHERRGEGNGEGRRFREGASVDLAGRRSAESRKSSRGCSAAPAVRAHRRQT